MAERERERERGKEKKSESKSEPKLIKAEPKSSSGGLICCLVQFSSDCRRWRRESTLGDC